MAFRIPSRPTPVELPAEQLIAFSPESLERLEGVNPVLVDLMKEVERRANERGLNLQVTEGIRDSERQRELLKQGKSQTLRSRHLTGNALDIHLRNEDGSPNWDFEAYQPIADIAKEVAAEQGVENLVWGGDWKTLKDGVHFELANADYAADQKTDAARRAQYGLGDRGVGTDAQVLQAVQRGDMTIDEAGKYVSEELLEGIKGGSAYDMLQAERESEKQGMAMLGQGLEMLNEGQPAPVEAPSARSLPMRLSPGRASATPGTQAIGRFGLESLLRGNPLLGIR